MAKKKKRTTIKYKSTYPDIAAELCREKGFTDAQLAKFFKVDRSTILRWKHTYPDFAEKLQNAKDTFDVDIVENELLKRARGYSYTETKKETDGQGKVIKITKIKKKVPGDVTAQIFWLKNRQPDRWKDRTQLGIGAEGGGPLVVEVVQFTKKKQKGGNGPDTDTK